MYPKYTHVGVYLTRLHKTHELDLYKVPGAPIYQSVLDGRLEVKSSQCSGGVVNPSEPETSFSFTHTDPWPFEGTWWSAPRLVDFFYILCS